jgi:hypothetical protein
MLTLAPNRESTVIQSTSNQQSKIAKSKIDLEMLHILVYGDSLSWGTARDTCRSVARRWLRTCQVKGQKAKVKGELEGGLGPKRRTWT